MPQNPNPKTWILAITLFAATRGCDDKSVQLAREAADRQAQQNNAMAELNKEVAAGTHQLIEADAKARQEIVGVHRDLQAERTRLDTSRTAIENERREIAGQRRTESLLASSTALIGGILLASLLLIFCWYALIAAHSDDSHAELNELLVREVLSAGPTLGVDSSPALLPHANRSLEAEGTSPPSP